MSRKSTRIAVLSNASESVQNTKKQPQSTNEEEDRLTTTVSAELIDISNMRSAVPQDATINMNRLEYRLRIERPNCCVICNGRFAEQVDEKIDDANKKRKRNDDEEFVHELPDAALREMCAVSNHSVWIVPTATPDAKYEFVDKFNEIGGFLRNVRNRKFDRICDDCFEKTILANAVDRPQSLQFIEGNLLMPCPVCAQMPFSRFLHTDTMLRYLRPPIRKQVEDALEREFIVRTTVFLHCPVVNCEHCEKYPKNKFNAVGGGNVIQSSIPDFLSCPDHGRFCSKCFAALRDHQHSHYCGGAPKEVLKSETKASIRRCYACNEAVEKNGGCSSMSCKCGSNFNWDVAKGLAKTFVRLNDIKK